MRRWKDSSGPNDRFSKIDDFGPGLRWLGGLQTSKIRALKGSKIGPANAGRKLTEAEKQDVIRKMKSEGKL